MLGPSPTRSTADSADHLNYPVVSFAPRIEVGVKCMDGGSASLSTLNTNVITGFLSVFSARFLSVFSVYVFSLCAFSVYVFCLCFLSVLSLCVFSVCVSHSVPKSFIFISIWLPDT